MSPGSQPLDMNEAARADDQFRWEAVEVVKAQELV